MLLIYTYTQMYNSHYIKIKYIPPISGKYKGLAPSVLICSNYRFVFNGKLTQDPLSGCEVWARPVEVMFLTIHVHALSKTPYGISRGSPLFIVSSLPYS